MRNASYGATIKIVGPDNQTTSFVWAFDQPDPVAVPSHGGGDVVRLSRTDALGRKTSYKYDTLGNVIEETIDVSGVSAPDILPLQDKNGAAVSQVITRYTYDPLFSKMTSKTDADGETTFYVYDSPVPVPGLPAGVAVTFSAKATGNLMATVDALQNVTSYTYAGPGQMADGNYGQDYGLGDLMSTTDPRGNTTQFTNYDAYGNLVRFVDATGNHVTTQAFDARSQMLSSKDTFGHHTEYAYDGLGRKVRETWIDDLYPVNNRFNGAPLPGLSPGVSWAEQNVFSFYPSGLVKQSFNGLGQEMEYFYDAGNRLREKVARNVVQADGTQVDIRNQYFYDQDNNLVRQVDYRDAGKPGIVTRNTYDALNRLRKTELLTGPSSAPVGLGATHVVMTADYDLAGNKTASTDHRGNVTTYRYDGLYRLVATQLPVADGTGQPAVVALGYDLAGNKVRQTDANGKVTTFAYDAADRLITVLDPVGNQLTYKYDKNGNIIQETHTTNGVDTYIVAYPEDQFDALNRPGQMDQYVVLGDPTVLGPASLAAGGPGHVKYVTTYTYDVGGRNTMVTISPRGHDSGDHVSGATETVSDGLDRLQSQTVDVGGLDLLTRYTYDANGNVATVQDPQSGDIDLRNTYDGLNRTIRIDYAAAPGDTGPVYETFTFDGNNNTVSHRDRRGIVFATVFDNADRALAESVIESLTHGGQTLTVAAYAYNDLLNTVTVTDARNNSTVTEMDALGRVTLLTDALGQTVRSFYDGVNMVTEIDKQLNLTRYSYDDINRLTLTEEFGTAGAGAPLTTVQTEYRDDRNLLVQTDRRGTQTIQQNDSLGRSIQLSRKHTDLAAAYGADEVVVARHQYDGDGNETLQFDSLGQQSLFVYDGAGRKTDVTDGFGSPVAGTTHYTYDNVGSVLTLKDARVSGAAFDVSYLYDTRYRRISATNGMGETTAYGYDANDNPVSMTVPRGVAAAIDPAHTTTYRYDEMDMLLSVDATGLGGGITRYVYDASRNRIAQQDPNGNLVTFQYDALNRLSDTYQSVAPGNIVAGTTRDGGFGGDSLTALHTHSGYDGNDNQILLIDPEGQRIDMGYDYLDRLVSTTFSGAVAPGLDFQPLSTTYVYGDKVNLTSVQMRKSVGAGIVTEIGTYEFDRLDRLVR